MDFSLEDLKESNDFLNTLIVNITSAIFIVDKEIRIQSFNDSFQALFSKHEDKLIGELCGNALGCEYAAREGKDCGTTDHCGACVLRESLLKAFTKKIPTYKEKLERDFFINGQYEKKHFFFTTKYIHFNKVEMILIIVDDITEIENQKIRLQELNNLKNEFLGIAAHDLRNPIGIVKMYTSMILEEINENLTNEQIEFLEIVLKNSDFMLKLLNDLLDISKIESGKLDLHIEPGNYIIFVEEVVRLNKIIAEKKKISLDFKYSENISEISFDNNRIKEVLNNLN